MTTEEHAKDQARAQYESICELLDALEVDYDRLEELRGAEELDDDEREELTDLENSAGDCESEDDALTRIQEDPLSVEVRSSWTSPGEDMTAEDFNILLCTGGPVSGMPE